MNERSILFIIPPFTEKVLYKAKSGRDTKERDLRVYPSLGVSYLISSLDKAPGISCAIGLIDAPAERLEEEAVLRKVIEAEPKIAAITVTSFTLAAARRLADGIRKALPGTRIILGGVHLNHFPSDFQHFNADYALIGDCELAIRDLVGAIFSGAGVESVPGIVYRKSPAGPGRSGELFIAPPASVADLDVLPFPDRSRLSPENYIFYLFNKKFATVITSRGCPFKCIYCGLPHNEAYKKRSVDNILGEMRQIKAEGYEYISFCDDIFTLDRQKTLSLCDRLIAENISISWGCSTRADCVDAPLLVKMRKAGCVDVRFGIESGDEKVRSEIINKKISNARFEEAVSAAKSAGLITTGYFIFGLPGETYTQMQSTVAFAKRLPLDYAYFGISMIIPNSGLHDVAIREGRIDGRLWEDVIQGKKEIPFYVPEGVTLEQMTALRDNAHRTFYLRPGYILSQIASIRSPKDLLFKARQAIALLFNRV